MDKPILTIHGAGRHGAVVADTALNLGWEVKFTDDSEGTAPLSGQPCIIAIGDNRARKARAEKNRDLVTIQDSSASITSASVIRPGCFIGRGAHVNNAASVGYGVIVNTGATVEHDCVVEDYCHLSPEATLGGGVVLGEGVWIGMNATVLPNLTIAPWSIIGAGAVVTKDITERGTYAGNPARTIR